MATRQALGDAAQQNGQSAESGHRHVSRRVSTKQPAAGPGPSKVERPRATPIAPQLGGDENDSLEVRLSDLIQRHQASKHKHSTEVSALQSTITELRLSFQKAHTDAANGKVDRDRLRKERDEARGRIRNAEDEAAKRQAAVLHAEERERGLRAEMAAMKLELRKAGEEAQEAKSTAERVLRERAEMEVELRRARAMDEAGRDEERGRMAEELEDARRQAKEARREKEAMEQELGRVKNENARLIAREDAVEAMEDEREWLEAALDVAADQCGKARLTMVDRRELVDAREEVILLKAERSSKKHAEHALRMEQRGLKEEITLLRERVDIAETGRIDAEELCQVLLEQRALDRQCSIPIRTDKNACDPLEPVLDVVSEMLVEYRDATLDTLLAQDELRATLFAHRDLLAKYHKSKEALALEKSTSASLQQTHRSLKDEIETLQTAHDTCEARLNASAAEVMRWQNAERDVSAELKEVAEEKELLEKKLKGEREEWKRAKESFARAMAAEKAYEEEIAQLREALDSAQGYEQLYNALVDQTEELAAREHVAAAEAERLGFENAQLIGHGNGDQRICYVESVRREMALTKHELITTRQSLNRANERLATLQEEVESYKSVSKDLGIGASTRTRVVRRVPEGSWLAKSGTGAGRASTGKSSRSVSGPGPIGR